MTFVDRIRGSEWSGASSEEHSPRCVSSSREHGNLYPRPMTHWAGENPDELTRAFYAQFTMEASLRHFDKASSPNVFDGFSSSCLPNATVPFNKSVLLQVFGCREILSNTVCFHKLAWVMPIFPNHLENRQNVIWPLGWHGKQMVNRVVRSTMLRNSNTCSSDSANKEIPLLTELCVHTGQLAGKWLFVAKQTSHLSSLAALKATLLASSFAKRHRTLLARMSRDLLISHHCQFYCIGNFLSKPRFVELKFHVELIIRHGWSRRIHLHIFGWKSFKPLGASFSIPRITDCAQARVCFEKILDRYV